MNCLVCGHKLAIFRKLSLGDFCCQEHRALYIKEQSDRGLARLMDGNGEPKARATAGTRVYAQFLLDDVAALRDEPEYVGYGPLAALRKVAIEAPQRSSPRLGLPRYTEFAELIKSRRGPIAPIGFELAGISLRLPSKRQPVWNQSGMGLRPAGLILPWSTGAGSQSVFSLAPLAAAAWAQAGFGKPILASDHPLPGALQFAWPAIEGSLELPAAAIERAPAALAAVHASAASTAQSMRVRLATPLVVRHKPNLQLSVPARIEDCPEPEPPAPVVAEPSTVAPPKRSLFATIFAPHPRPALTTRARLHDADEIYGYEEAVQNRKSSARGAWMAMMAGWAPSAAGVSVLFAVLFLFSAITIFLSAPSTMSNRGPSFRWGNLRAAIRNRAVMKVEDDFRSGLNGWTFPSGWSQDWSYDQAGFLRPGKLGFLDQSMRLVNYRLELMGQIERKSLGWAFRAKDSKNYYVAKLTIARPGPLPMVDLIHYPVLNGKEGAKVRVTLPFSVRNDTLYQVEMNVRGDHFRASVNGHVVDSWSDNSLRAGGVGFVTGQGEASRVRWIRVSDRDDVIGRVCSYLSARASQPLDDPLLSASQYTIFRRPGL